MKHMKVSLLYPAILLGLIGFLSGCGDTSEPAVKVSDPVSRTTPEGDASVPPQGTVGDSMAGGPGDAAHTRTPAAAVKRARPYPPELPVDNQLPSLKIAFISYANPQQVVKDSEPIVAFLKRFVGTQVEGFVTTDYGASIEAMRNDKADVAFVDPLAFMMAYEQIGAKPLLLEVYYGGRPRYHSSIWVRKDSGIRSVSDLKGKSIAFADQVDMSGHLLPREIFVREGLLGDSLVEGEFFKQTYFAGGDEQAIRAVLGKFVDAAGVSQYAELLLRPEERDHVITIADSIESPSHLVMVRQGLSDVMAGRLKAALLALDYSDPQDKVILDKLYGVQGYVEAKLSDFAEVARVAARYGFVKKPAAFAAADSP